MNNKEYWDDVMSKIEYIESIRDQRYERFVVTIKDDICIIETTRKSKSSFKAFKTIGFNKYDAVTRTVEDFLNWYNNIK